MRRVTVNEKIIIHPAFQVSPTDIVTFDGQPVVPDDQLVYLQLYKPRGTLTTVRDPGGRETVMKYVAEIQERIFPVGRLDYDSEGLLIFTNDGRITNFLTHPRYQIMKTYRVYASGRVKSDDLILLTKGVENKGQMYQTQSATILENHPGFTIVDVTLSEGKKHEVRILFEQIGHPVLRLIRTQMGPISLDENLLPGEWRFLTAKEINRLFDRDGVVIHVNQ